MTLRLLTSDAALVHIGAQTFVTAWRALHAICPWATACQHPDFVLAWYGLYGALFVPVVVLQESADGALVGLLPLALDDKGQRLTGAGERHAEYQGWLQPPAPAQRSSRGRCAPFASIFRAPILRCVTCRPARRCPGSRRGATTPPIYDIGSRCAACAGR
jgi:CelD/BcsL family acetyltransferase involved in cellulose biosynthesis